MSKKIDAKVLAEISGSCMHMMQDAACAYYSRDEAQQGRFSSRVFEEFRDLADRLGFKLVAHTPSVPQEAA